MKTISRPTPYQLADAITDTALRFAEASRRGAYAYDKMLDGRADGRAEVDHWERIARWRFRAIQRLTEALRKQADAPKEEKWT